MQCSYSQGEINVNSSRIYGFRSRQTVELSKGGVHLLEYKFIKPRNMHMINTEPSFRAQALRERTSRRTCVLEWCLKIDPTNPEQPRCSWVRVSSYVEKEEEQAGQPSSMDVNFFRQPGVVPRRGYLIVIKFLNSPLFEFEIKL